MMRISCVMFCLTSLLYKHISVRTTCLPQDICANRFSRNGEMTQREKGGGGGGGGMVLYQRR